MHKAKRKKDGVAMEQLSFIGTDTAQPAFDS